MDSEVKYEDVARRLRDAVEVVLGMPLEECFKLVDIRLDEMQVRIEALEANSVQGDRNATGSKEPTND